MLEIRFFNYICDDVPECHDKIIIRKRFAYLANENLRNFQRMQEITRRIPCYMAWAVVSYLAYTVFSGPSFGDM